MMRNKKRQKSVYIREKLPYVYYTVNIFPVLGGTDVGPNRFDTSRSVHVRSSPLRSILVTIHGYLSCSILDTIHDAYYVPIGTYVLTATYSSHVIRNT